MGLRLLEITEETTLWVTVAVAGSDGAPKALAGATYHATMGREGLQVTGTVMPVSLSQGTVQVRFPAATGMQGWVLASLHVTIGGETQCVWRERIRVYDNLEG